MRPRGGAVVFRRRWPASRPRSLRVVDGHAGRHASSSIPGSVLCQIGSPQHNRGRLQEVALPVLQHRLGEVVRRKVRPVAEAGAPVLNGVRAAVRHPSNSDRRGRWETTTLTGADRQWSGRCFSRLVPRVTDGYVAQAGHPLGVALVPGDFDRQRPRRRCERSTRPGVEAPRRC